MPTSPAVPSEMQQAVMGSEGSTKECRMLVGTVAAVVVGLWTLVVAGKLWIAIAVREAAMRGLWEEEEKDEGEREGQMAAAKEDEKRWLTTVAVELAHPPVEPPLSEKREHW